MFWNAFKNAFSSKKGKVVVRSRDAHIEFCWLTVNLKTVCLQENSKKPQRLSCTSWSGWLSLAKYTRRFGEFFCTAWMEAVTCWFWHLLLCIECCYQVFKDDRMKETTGRVFKLIVMVPWASSTLYLFSWPFSNIDTVFLFVANWTHWSRCPSHTQTHMLKHTYSRASLSLFCSSNQTHPLVVRQACRG